MKIPTIQIDKEAYKIYIIAGYEPLHNDVDVLVKPVGADYYYTATFMLTEAINEYLLTEDEKPAYFYCPDLIVVHEISVKTIEEVIDGIFENEKQNLVLQKHYSCDEEEGN